MPKKKAAKKLIVPDFTDQQLDELEAKHTPDYGSMDVNELLAKVASGDEMAMQFIADLTRNIKNPTKEPATGAKPATRKLRRGEYVDKDGKIRRIKPTDNIIAELEEIELEQEQPKKRKRKNPALEAHRANLQAATQPKRKHKGEKQAQLVPFQKKKRPNKFVDDKTIHAEDIVIHEGTKGAARQRPRVHLTEVECIYCHETYELPENYPLTLDRGFCCNACGGAAKL